MPAPYWIPPGSLPALPGLLDGWRPGLPLPRAGIGRERGRVQRSLAWQVRQHPWMEEIAAFKARRYSERGGPVYDFALFAPARTVSERCWRPERALVATLVLVTLADALHPAPARVATTGSRPSRSDQDEARLWFFIEDEEPGSLAWALGHLELEVTAVRGRVAYALLHPHARAAMFERARGCQHYTGWMGNRVGRAIDGDAPRELTSAQRRAMLRAQLRAQWWHPLTEREVEDRDAWRAVARVINGEEVVA